MLTVESIVDPIYGNKEQTQIICKVKFIEFDEYHNYAATAWDTVPHGQQIYNDLKAGKYGTIGAYEEPPAVVGVSPTQNQPNTTGTQQA